MNLLNEVEISVGLGVCLEVRSFIQMRLASEKLSVRRLGP